MTRTSSRLCCLILFATILSCDAPSWAQFGSSPDANKQAGQGAVAIQPERAAKNLIKKVAVVYPPLAKQARWQGTVKLQAVISKDGTVDSVKALSGPPLLVQAAVDAVKQWQYKPFIADGQPVAASTEVEVPFTLGISDADF